MALWPAPRGRMDDWSLSARPRAAANGKETNTAKPVTLTQARFFMDDIYRNVRIELYFSIIQRKALTPNDFSSLDALAERLLRFGDHYRQIGQPFEWTFTRTDLDRLLARIDAHEPNLKLAA
jgi:hypothetical protein